MKLKYSIIYLAILNVVCCYPSSGENESQIEKIRSSESGSTTVSMPLSYLDESQVAKENYFPEDEYPTKMLDTIEPLYYLAADHTDYLAPFTSDVKDSFRSLQAEQNVKEHPARQDSISPRDINIHQTVEDTADLLVNDPSSYKVANTTEVSVCEGYLQAASEKEVEIPGDTNCQYNVDDENIEPTSEEEIEVSDDTNSQFNVDNENVEPTSKEVKISDSTNSQFNVDTENIEPTRIPTESTDASEATLDDSPENSEEIVSRRRK